MRPETGPMQFEDDWRGVFIRGDNALLRYLPMLQIIKANISDENEDDVILALGIDDLINLLASANHHVDDKNVQMMKKFEDCKK